MKDYQVGQHSNFIDEQIEERKNQGKTYTAATAEVVKKAEEAGDNPLNPYSKAFYSTREAGDPAEPEVRTFTGVDLHERAEAIAKEQKISYRDALPIAQLEGA